MYQFSLLCCICVSMLSLESSLDIVNFEKGNPGWFADKPIISDWRGIPDVDWSTNVPVSRFYCEGANNSLRVINIERFAEELCFGDNLSIGIDWYGLKGISSPFIPDELLNTERGFIIGGGVVVYGVYADNGKMIWVKTK